MSKNWISYNLFCTECFTKFYKNWFQGVKFDILLVPESLNTELISMDTYSKASQPKFNGIEISMNVL